MLFIQHTKAKDYDPALTMNKEPITDMAPLMDDFLDRLKEKLAELYNPDVPFSLTGDANICRVCPFKLMCRG